VDEVVDAGEEESAGQAVAQGRADVPSVPEEELRDVRDAASASEKSTNDMATLPGSDLATVTIAPASPAGPSRGS
jgi:hypothetical protein